MSRPISPHPNLVTGAGLSEDEADPASGTLSHVSPLAGALIGKAVGDVAGFNGRELEIVALG